MTYLLGIDIGTTTITSVAVDADSGTIAELATTSNDARYDNRPQGRSEDQLERRIVRGFTGGGAAAERLALVGTGGRKAAVCVEDVGVGTDMLCDGTAR